MQHQHLNAMNQGHDAQNSLNNHFDGKTRLGLRYDKIMIIPLLRNRILRKIMDCFSVLVEGE